MRPSFARSELPVQTFLPYPAFAASARALDERRLGKQRVEALQVLRGLLVPGYGWRHHPAVKMWRGFPEALALYGVEMCREWRRRGHPDTCEPQLVGHVPGADTLTQEQLATAGRVPPWLGDPAFHRAHQSALVRKDPLHYGPQFPGVPPDLPYVWPQPAE